MIAFDIDGVLIPNWNCEMGLDHYLHSRNMWKPLFEPKGDYYLITSRPIEDSQKTKRWVNDNFINKPKLVFCENMFGFGDDNAVKYKAQILSVHPEVTIYVESELNQVLKLKKLLNISILHFESIIGGALENLSSL